jgi:ABC-type Mn2+/Zn2+ transport system permease subunit
MGDPQPEKSEKETKPRDGMSVDTLDVVFFLAAALVTGILSVITGFISSFDTFAKKPPPLHALGPVALAGAATGIWIRSKLFKKKQRPPRTPSAMGFCASALTIAGLIVWFVGVVEFLNYFRPYTRDLSIGTWTLPLCLAFAGSVLVAAGRILDRRLRKNDAES